MSSFAIAPTINPKTIQPSTPNIVTPPCAGSANRVTLVLAAPDVEVPAPDEIEVLQRAARIEEYDRLMRLDRAVGRKASDRFERRAALGRGADAFAAADLEHSVDHRAVAHGD